MNMITVMVSKIEKHSSTKLVPTLHSSMQKQNHEMQKYLTRVRIMNQSGLEQYSFLHNTGMESWISNYRGT